MAPRRQCRSVAARGPRPPRRRGVGRGRGHRDRPFQAPRDDGHALSGQWQEGLDRRGHGPRPEPQVRLILRRRAGAATQGPMRIIRDTLFLDPYDRGAAAAIGNFDGVHLGHQAVIDIARAEARLLDVPLGVMTFEPHPREFFAPDAPAFRLMNAEARTHRLEKLGVGQLPGDVRFSLFGKKIFLPFASTILLSTLIFLIARFI